ncbi:ras-related and estrogen-regulated growth inhibitor-like protein [Amblyraja radiata]|uniref:ras-related and estrogen-regulated growth inhibitor-like protein n=1 Tax=Amblyraja radiata TaxID=386614 RepID=UPI00140319B2|nr:ras-related and estrogen-regulated growth inhibitor-like protein [Amblyraja radiata]
MNEIKLAVLGSEGVGKSALIVRFLTKRFIGEYASNSECIYKKRLSVDGRQINLEIFDPCSQNLENKSLLTDQMNWADGFVVVYDIGDRSSFISARTLIKQLRETNSEIYKRDVTSVIVLVGNKQDLCHVREVREEEGMLFARENKCHFSELSAAEDRQEVGKMFSKAIRNASGNRRRRPSGSKSMAKLINNVFGKRRKSV